METAPVSVQMLPITVTVNGATWSGEVAAEEVLLELLRRHIGLTGTKRSCESQVCGACTVLVDNRPVSSCSYLAFEVNGCSVTTIEGLGTPEHPDAVQAAFARNMAFQCGYCISGQIIAAKALLMENAAPSYDEIAEWMVGNTCRCGCYAAIARAIQEAATAQATTASG